MEIVFDDVKTRKELNLENKNIEKFNINDDNIIFTSIENNDYIKSFNILDPIINAYIGHYDLVLDPKYFLILFQANIINLINGNPGKYRNKFVNFEGKEKISTVVDKFDKNNVIYFIDKLFNVVSEKINMDIKDNWTSNFTTSTLNDKLVSYVGLLSMMKNYFEYGMIILCGIPKFIIKGNQNDWKNLYNKIKFFLNFDNSIEKFNFWINEILNIIKKFINLFDGGDKLFLKNICNKIDNGCGRQYLNGWISLFNAIDSNGNFIYGSLENKLGIEDIISNSFNFSINVNNNGNEFEVILNGGLMIYECNNDIIEPRFDWVLTEKKYEISPIKEYDYYKTQFMPSNVNLKEHMMKNQNFFVRFLNKLFKK